MSVATSVSPAGGAVATPAAKKSEGGLTYGILAVSVILSIVTIGLTSASLFFKQLPLETFLSEHPKPNGNSFLDLGPLGTNTGYLNYYGSCSELYTEIYNNEMWDGCYGYEKKNPASLARNVKRLGTNGFIKPYLPGTYVCEEDAWNQNREWQYQVGFKNKGGWTTKDLGMSDLAENLRSEWFPRLQKNSAYAKCMASSGAGKLALIVAMCIIVLVATMIASAGAVLRPKSCFRQSSVLYVLASALFMMTVIFAFNTESTISRIRSYGITECKGLPAKEYFSKLPADTCRVSRVYTMCVDGENDQVYYGMDKDDWISIDVFERERRCMNMVGGNTKVFVPQSRMKRNCASQQSVCLGLGEELTTTDPETSDSPPPPEKCLQCTNGPNWDLNLYSSNPPNPPLAALPINSDDPDKPEKIWNGGYRASSSYGDTCMWVSEDYPGDDPTGFPAVNSKRCVNRFEELYSSSCDSYGYAQYVFEYGANDICENIAHPYSESPASYPECVKENYEQCFVRRGSSEEQPLDESDQIENPDNTAQKITQGGGQFLGENNCVLDNTEVTKCVCSCSAADIQLERCTFGDQDPTTTPLSKATMTEKHPKFTVCGANNVCSTMAEVTSCSFLGLYKPDVDKRWAVETGACSGRRAWDCNDDLCGIDLDGQCISKYVECSSEQKDYFTKLEDAFKASRRPSDCLTDINGDYKNKVAVAKNDEHNVLLASIVFLFLVCVCTLVIAVVVGAGKTTLALAPAGSWNPKV